MGNFIHITLAIEVAPDRKYPVRPQNLNELRKDLVRYLDNVALAEHIKAKHLVVDVSDMPNEQGWHSHDNDGSCTACSNLYGWTHDDTI